VYSPHDDQFYSSPEEAAEYLEQDKPQLQVTAPVYARALCLDYFEDQLDDDYTADPTLCKAIDQFNDSVKDLILSYEPRDILVKW